MKSMGAAFAKVAAGIVVFASTLMGGVGAGYAHGHKETVNLRAASLPGYCLSLWQGAHMAECGSQKLQEIELVRIEGSSWNLIVNGSCIAPPRVTSEPVRMAQCNSQMYQRWYFNSHGQIKNQNGECLHVWSGGGASRPKVTTNRCTGQRNQNWAKYQVMDRGGAPDITRNQMVTPKHAPGKCIDLAHQRDVIIWDCHGRKNQLVSFEWRSQTQIRIEGKCLTAIDRGPVGKVEAQECRRGATSQIWDVNRNGEIRSSSRRCLDVERGSLRNGTNLVTFRCNGQNNQRFYLR